MNNFNILYESTKNKIKIDRYDEYLENILDSGADKEYAEDLLKYKIKELEKIKKQTTIKLHRLIFIKDKKDINLKKLGHHYIQDISDFHEEMVDYLYGNAKKSNKNLKEEDIKVLTIKSPTTNIDYDETILTYSLHPFENEITLQTLHNIKIDKLEDYYE